MHGKLSSGRGVAGTKKVGGGGGGQTPKKIRAPVLRINDTHYTTLNLSDVLVSEVCRGIADDKKLSLTGKKSGVAMPPSQKVPPFPTPLIWSIVERLCIFKMYTGTPGWQYIIQIMIRQP